jgi:hypothetical protein
MSRTKASALGALFGALLIFVGVFGFLGRCAVPGAPCPSPSLNEIAAYGGLVVLLISVAALVWLGWRGSLLASALGAVGAVPATWFAYEIARQSGCPLLTDPALADACLTAYGEMTAPVLSFGVAGLILLMGWARRGRRRSRQVASV